MSEEFDNMNKEPVLQLKCYEPAGISVDFNEEDLLGHTIAFGGSGSGKTTRVIYPSIDQLIRYQAENVRQKHALVIHDTKADGDLHKLITSACNQAGRLDDLVIIDGSGDHYLNPLQALADEGIDGVEKVASLFAAGIPRDINNRYWERTFEMLVRQVLRLFVLSKQTLEMEAFLDICIHYLLHHKARDPYFTSMTDALDRQKADASGALKLAIEEALATHKMWEVLDFRTRSILQSMATSLVSPLNQPLAMKYLSGQRECDIKDAIASGKIILLSVDALRHPELACMLGIILKSQFYEAVLERGRTTANSRLAGLIMDDWALTATGDRGTRYSDVEALSMIRSRKGYMITASQGIAGLDLAIGENGRRAALANFANIICFRARDAALDAMAAAYFGEKKEMLVDRTVTESPKKIARNSNVIRIEREHRRPAVPLGALARLATGDAYALVGPVIYDNPLCFVPTYSPEITKDNEYER